VRQSNKSAINVIEEADEKGASQIVAESGAAVETSLCSVDTEAEVGTA
jgi:hypothetical protein